MKKFLEQKKSAIVSGMSNNKGFSLVELIIVVAIMAVLMGVLAPQYLRFVESSREQTDASAANEIVKSMVIACSTVEGVPAGATVSWASATGDVTVANGDADGKFASEISKTIGTNIGSMASNWATGTGTLVLTVGLKDGVPFVWTNSTSTVTGDTWNDRLGIPSVGS